MSEMANGVLSAVYDPVNQQLNTTDMGAASGNFEPTDQNGVWSNVYDPTTGTLRVVTV